MKLRSLAPSAPACTRSVETAACLKAHSDARRAQITVPLGSQAGHSCMHTYFIYKRAAPAPWNDDISVLAAGRHEGVKRGLHKLGILLDHACNVAPPHRHVPLYSARQPETGQGLCASTESCRSCYPPQICRPCTCECALCCTPLARCRNMKHIVREVQVS